MGKGPISLTSCSNDHNRPYRTLGLTFGSCKKLPPPTLKGPAVSARHRSGSSGSCDNDPAKAPRGSLFVRSPSWADALTLRGVIPTAGLLPAPKREFLGALRSLGEAGPPRDLVVILQSPLHPPPAAKDGGGRPSLMMMIQSSAPAEAWDRLMQSRCRRRRGGRLGHYHTRTR